jgi:hypothetical protein
MIGDAGATGFGSLPGEDGAAGGIRRGLATGAGAA